MEKRFVFQVDGSPKYEFGENAEHARTRLIARLFKESDEPFGNISEGVEVQSD